MSEDWIEDCLKFHGKILTGKFAHWCPEWDDLPIDETCGEFEVCTCFPKTDEIRNIQEKLLNDRMNDDIGIDWDNDVLPKRE